VVTGILRPEICGCNKKLQPGEVTYPPENRRLIANVWKTQKRAPTTSKMLMQVLHAKLILIEETKRGGQGRNDASGG